MPLTVMNKRNRFVNAILRTKFVDAVIKSLIDPSMRKKWKETPYDRSLLYTLVITDKCTLKCEHCFEEACPENNTFLDADRIDDLVEESIDVFQGYKEPRSIRVTGGDPFLHPDLYKIIQSFSKRKDKLGYSTLDVETNGWWATDDERARDTILKLKEAGADLLSMTVDYFHRKAAEFDNHKHFERLHDIAGKEGLRFRYIAIGMPNFKAAYELGLSEFAGLGFPEVTPIGRARQLPEVCWGEHLTCKMEGCRLMPPTLCYVEGEWVHTDEITIQRDGNVYPCNSGKEFEYVTLSLGNIYDKSLPEILANQNNHVVNLIREQGLRGLSKKAGIGWYRHWRMYDRFSPCGLCHELLREHGERIAFGK